MTINYPNGKKFIPPSPLLKTKRSSSRVQHGKRGMRLEEEIAASNAFYLEREIAVIIKNQLLSKLLKLIIPNEVLLLLMKLTIAIHLQLTSTVFIEANTLTLKQKKRKINYRFLLKIFMSIRLFIWRNVKN